MQRHLLRLPSCRANGKCDRIGHDLLIQGTRATMAQRQTSPTPRRLLARVRDVMAGAGTAQERLNEIVAIIATDMVAEVCSIYVQRAGEVLELFATQGLKPTAVHQTRLRVGEGLIGHIADHARPLNLADAQNHPLFAFRPETGEEIYQSLMGVPILRGGRVIGVLAVQNRTRRNYAEEEVETLQTVAMVLAEMVAGGELISRDEMLPADGNALLPLRLEGVRLNSGHGMGVAVVHKPHHNVRHLVAENPDHEHERLRSAVSEMHGALDDMLKATDLADGGEPRDILETYRMIAEDAGWLARMDEAISSGLTAEAAVQKVHNDIRARMSKVTDPYLHERLHDLEDLANRLQHHLIGGDEMAPQNNLPGEVILVARTMGPAQLLDYDRTSLRGLVLEEGSPTAHVAIVARALDIPVVGQARNVLSRIEPGDPVMVDGDNGLVYIRPGEELVHGFQETIAARHRSKAAYASLRDLPAVTLDGERIELNINAGLLVDMQYLEETGADGIGLYRTEVPFMVRSQFPDVEAQSALYGTILDQAKDKPVLFRTLDVGGDKVLPYWSQSVEENPTMGWRAIRIALDRPALLRQQLRAMIQAAGGRDLRLMFPMIAEVAEFDAARAIVDLELDRARDRGSPTPKSLRVGSMIEVPSLAFQMPALLERVDFLSVGSNDLFQFLFASDRGNPRLSDRYDPLSPAVLSFLRTVLDQCRDADVPLGLCGEMAARPLDAMALIGLGFRNISVPPPFVGPTKMMIRSLSVEPLAQYMDALYNLPRHSVRSSLKAFALDHGAKI